MSRIIEFYIDHFLEACLHFLIGMHYIVCLRHLTNCQLKNREYDAVIKKKVRALTLKLKRIQNPKTHKNLGSLLMINLNTMELSLASDKMLNPKITEFGNIESWVSVEAT